jgi:hypothetical protein
MCIYTFDCIYIYLCICFWFKCKLVVYVVNIGALQLLELCACAHNSSARARALDIYIVKYIYTSARTLAFRFVPMYINKYTHRYKPF